LSSIKLAGPNQQNQIEPIGIFNTHFVLNFVLLMIILYRVAISKKIMMLANIKQAGSIQNKRKKEK